MRAGIHMRRTLMGVEATLCSNINIMIMPEITIIVSIYYPASSAVEGCSVERRGERACA